MTSVVFMGTPEFAVPSLRALARAYSVVGVVTQPDRPAGRGRQLVAPPVKTAAQDLGIPIIQPDRLREPAAMEQLKAWAPDLIVVAAFGQLLRPAVLDLPRFGCVNVHASLLPRHRGAAPISAAILAGDSETGVTIMRMDVGLDTGPMLLARSLPISDSDTTASLTASLATLGADLLLETLPGYLAGTVPPRPQDDALATYAPQLKKEDGRLDFSETAEELARRVRAFSPWPGAYCLWQGQPLKVLEARPISGRGVPRTVSGGLDGPALTCADGQLLLIKIQPAGKRPMSALDFARGTRDFVGSQVS
ncbi:MAG TPA: methionyl-tRNA formyltransferase [Anaerolineales bacterium]|nr:methionyl-tRNA formyltransferase [Anaerolineales bacterium]